MTSEGHAAVHTWTGHRVNSTCNPPYNTRHQILRNFLFLGRNWTTLGNRAVSDPRLVQQLEHQHWHTQHHAQLSYDTLQLSMSVWQYGINGHTTWNHCQWQTVQYSQHSFCWICCTHISILHTPCVTWWQNNNCTMQKNPNNYEKQTSQPAACKSNQPASQYVNKQALH